MNPTPSSPLSSRSSPPPLSPRAGEISIQAANEGNIPFEAAMAETSVDMDSSPPIGSPSVTIASPGDSSVRSRESDEIKDEKGLSMWMSSLGWGTPPDAAFLPSMNESETPSPPTNGEDPLQEKNEADEVPVNSRPLPSTGPLSPAANAEGSDVFSAPLPFTSMIGPAAEAAASVEGSTMDTTKIPSEKMGFGKNVHLGSQAEGDLFPQATVPQGEAHPAWTAKMSASSVQMPDEIPSLSVRSGSPSETLEPKAHSSGVGAAHAIAKEVMFPSPSTPTMPMENGRPHAGFPMSVDPLRRMAASPTNDAAVVQANSLDHLPETLHSILNDPRISPPKRVEIHLSTPAGAVVSLYLSRNNGELRAQLSTGDPIAYQWLLQQAPSLREASFGMAVAWLPPQREDEKSFGPHDRESRERRRNSRSESEPSASMSAFHSQPTPNRRTFP